MADFSAVTDEIRAYGARTAGMAKGVRGAADSTALADPGLLAPVFGLLGGDFLAAYARVHGAHTAALTELADTLGAMSATAGATADAYDATDQDAATGITNAGTGVSA